VKLRALNIFKKINKDMPPFTSSFENVFLVIILLNYAALNRKIRKPSAIINT